MEYLASDKIAIVDLNTGDITEDELDEDLVLDKIGGAGITKHLYDQHASAQSTGNGPIVLGTGLLTGTLVPGSSLGLITAKSPVHWKSLSYPLEPRCGYRTKILRF